MSKYKEVRRTVKIMCSDCWGTSRTLGGKCETCKGTGQVDRVIVELVPDDERVTTA